MARYFTLAEGGAEVEFEDYEAALLAGYARQMLELIDARERPAGGGAEDLIASAFREGPSERPADPALARLFPDAYTESGPGGDAAAASAEFRRYTEGDLRARKHEDAAALVASLESLGEGPLVLGPEDCRRWLGALNDLRLTVASRLGIVDEASLEALGDLPEDDPRDGLMMVYEWLTMLQESLVGSMPR
ncbi:DUF2017 domain-containing protein [Glycomyces paridis]|uniref:DUF2017 domain-containing protein n=1 Tax=Glycomyces paridis TaxID=2126555 RepID=A0A4S8PM72_9ACTN|nr:DUF2017 domain-containing protein [Glycomyces paridis]THV30835.1 DUF2017 domain-containing protein [Glycomyces paridis]